ncbi:autotransporter outer membrane beta-barrel domain-containing protein (plasmid) [Roseovarius faecimaris]|uniref:Autotransporter outer membrane beta-barrel domain-containing protein n=1 Tax=Roseovarius faecimaris TaxID=2494550 RepID=A0A6I6IIY4_9RHOB|nr:autotransporter domain-containing protein [Roseovarius faecimaris]QGX96759.1 autotransporter outer membrane beta-barrel domain-containing protein [Roseovarius faecimaris]
MTMFLRAICAVFLGVCMLAMSKPAEAQSAVSFSKVFSPDTIGPGGTSTLIFTITNNTASPVTDLAFTDILPPAPGAMTISPAPNASTTCTDGVLSAPAGGTTISYSGGAVAGNASCTVSVNVTASTVGTYSNVSGNLSSSAGNSGSATDDLTVASDRPGFSKSFAPASIPLGGRSTLTYTIDNTANANQVFNLDFEHTLPGGVAVASPANASTTCGGGAISAPVGGSVISYGPVFSGNATVAAGASCTVSVDVTGTGVGVFDSVTGDLTSGTFPIQNSGAASATLEVTGGDQLQITKQFTDDPVAPGATATLEFTLQNNDRNFAATGVAFSDDLDAMLSGATFAGMATFNSCGGSGGGTGTFSYSGGTIAAGASCTIRIPVSIPGGAADGGYVNTTSTVTGTIDGAAASGVAASDTLFVESAIPALTKSFLTSSITAGQNTTIAFTITNPSATETMTDLSFTDNLSQFLSGATLTGVVAPGFCGGSSQAFGITSGGETLLFMTGGSLAPGGSCSFNAVISTPANTPGGIYPNTTSTITGTVGGAPVVGPAASDSLTVNGGVNLKLSKVFTNSPVNAGDTATLVFTIDNTEGAVDATGLAFSDDLDAMLSGAQAVSQSASGCSSLAPGPIPASAFSISNATVPAGGTCTITVGVSIPAGAATGDYLNTTSALTGDAGIGDEPAQATLRVLGADDQPVTLSKAFIGGPFLPGETATLRFTLTNPNATSDATGIFFTDDLDANLPGLAATGPLPAAPCGAGSSISGTNFLTFTGGEVAAGAPPCVFDVSVLIPAGAASGSYGNTTSSVTATVNGNATIGDPANAALVVEESQLEITKTFIDPVAKAGALAAMEITVTNPTGSVLTTATYTDDLNAMLPGTIAGGNGFVGCSGGVFVAGSGTSNLTVTISNLPAGQSCTHRFLVQPPSGAAPGSYTNTVSDLSGTVGGLAITGPTATASLQVIATDAPKFSKAFAGSVFPGEVASLSFTIDNSASAAALSDLSFTDDFDAMLSGAVMTGVTGNSCGGTANGAGTGFLAFSGGSVAAGASCVLNVGVRVPLGTAGGSYPNTSSALSSQGLTLAPAATASLVVNPVFAPGFAKVFTPDALRQGEVSRMRFTIDNAANGIAAVDLAFTDVFPAGLEVADPANRNNSCGGTVTALPGATDLSLTGGTVGAGASCVIEVDVLAAGSGPLVNTTSALTSANLPTAPAASATLTSTAAGAPVFTKAFAPDTLDQGEITTMSFTVDNSANALAAADLAFTDPFPAGLEVADPANLSNGCGGTFTAVPGAADVSLTGGSAPADGTCLIEVDVRATAAGPSITNTTSVLSSSLPDAAPASATLNITAAAVPGFAKVFAPDVISQGEISTLSFTIDNAANAIEATGLAFDDPLPAGLVVASPAAVSNSCGGTVTATPGTASLSLASGEVAAGASCTISVGIQGLVAGAFDNVTSPLSTSLGDAAAASDRLTVNALPLTASMSFAPGTIEQFNTSVLSYTLTNAAQIAAGDVTLTDTLPADVTLASPASPANSCGGSLSAADGGSSVSLTGGTVAAGGSCTVSVTVISGVVGDYPNSTETVSSSLGTSAAASATLTVERATTGTLTIVQNTDTDGAYTFSSASAGLNFTINTAGGTGSSGPLTVPVGTHVVLQSTPDGVGNTAITCSDDDSVGQPRERRLTINIDPLEAVTCTFTSISSRQKTVDTINRFLTKRADLILSSEPSNARRFNRLKRGVGGSTPLSFANGDLNAFLPFTAQISTASDSYTLSTSFLQMREAAASLALAHGDQRGIRHIPNYRWDAWFEAQYKEFNAGPDSGHFAIAYFGADYLLTPDILVGALVQVDDMDDSSAALSSSVSGTGWMAGPYVTARIGPNLYFDGRIAAGTSQNDISPFNTYTDEFSTERWMAMAGITGEFQQGNWMIQPGASLSYFEEKQFSYVDSVGVVIPSQVVSLGQIKIGPTVSGQFQTRDGMDYMPYVSLDAIYNFGDTKGVTVTNPDTAVTDGWRGRVQAGVDFRLRNGASVSLGGSYDGIGRGSLDVWGATLKLEFPIQKATAK